MWTRGATRAHVLPRASKKTCWLQALALLPSLPVGARSLQEPSKDTRGLSLDSLTKPHFPAACPPVSVEERPHSCWGRIAHEVAGVPVAAPGVPPSWAVHARCLAHRGHEDCGVRHPHR